MVQEVLRGDEDQRLGATGRLAGGARRHPRRGIVRCHLRARRGRNAVETGCRGDHLGAAGLAGLDALIALQSIDPDGPRRRRRAAKRGHDLLDVLEEIKIGLLSGAVSGSALDRITALLGGLEMSGDARLDDLIADISLRAEVEMAKLGRYLDRA